MKIVNKRVSFGTIRQGECFFDEEGDLCMKIEKTISGMNAVELSKGYAYTYDEDSQVISIDAEITLY